METRYMIPTRRLKRQKVLVGTPHAEVKNYCLDKYIDNVKGLTYPFHDLLVVDNSATHHNAKNIKKRGVPAVHIKRKNKHTRQLLAESHNYLREVTLKNGYDYLLHFESDITPPPNVIEHLLSHQLPVVSAPYFIDFGHNSHLMAQDIEEKCVGIRKTINLDKGSDFHIMDGKLQKGFAFGLGMCLIHRDILEKVKFRYEENVDAHPDTFFANDLEQLGIEQYLDTSIICEHDNTDWLTIENR
jgi:GT2 family glycosyltransferase